MLRLLLVMLAAAVALAFAPLPFPKPPPARPPLDDLMGDWQDVANATRGLNITRKEFAYVIPGRRYNVFTLTLDVSRIPYRYDFRNFTGSFVGIWKIEGDKLTVRYAPEKHGVADRGRPTTFGTPGHNEDYYIRKAPGGWKLP